MTLPPLPLRVGPPRDMRGIPALHQMDSYWIRVSEAFSARLRETPGRIATAYCPPIPTSTWSASTPCYVTDRDGTTTTWTATVVGSCIDPVIQFTEGKRARPWPTPLPGVAIPVVDCPPSG